MKEHYDIVYYTDKGRDVIRDWLGSLRDIRGKTAVLRTIARISEGNFGNNHYCRDGVWELIIDTGPGYRVYYSMAGNVIVLLLCAGTKRTQDKDITRAVEYLKEFKERNTR